MISTPQKVASIVFLVVGLAHLSRLVFRFALVIGDWQVPLWVNAVAGVAAFLLSVWLWKSGR